MKSKSGKRLEIRKFEEQLQTLYSRVDNLENLTSRYNSNNEELQVMNTEQPGDVGNRQEQQVNTFLV